MSDLETAPDDDSAVPGPTEETNEVAEGDTPHERNKKGAVILAGTAVLALAAGIGIGIATQQPQIAELAEKAEAANAQMHVEIKAKNKAREDARAQIEAAKAELADRESAVASAEIEKANNEFGNGLFVVGTDISAGTFRSDNSGESCYYAWLSGTGADADIIDNNIVKSGPATVTIQDGQVFESRSCGTWIRQ